MDGDQYSEADKEAFMEIGGETPNVACYPYTYAWYSIVSRFSWAADIVAKANAGSAKQTKTMTQNEETKEESK